jgi:hypothetical protein
MVSFSWQEPQFGRLPSATLLNLILTEGRAYALEQLLSPSAKQALSGHLADITTRLSELAVAWEKELSRIKLRLRGDPTRTIAIHTKPRESDPRYPDLLKARVTMGKDGAVWGDIVGGTELHFLVHWKEWPTMLQIREVQLDLIRTRRTRVHTWITQQYATIGPSLFVQR